MTGIDLEELRREVMFGRSEVNNAYWMGKLVAMKTLRKSTKDFAMAGSPQAEEKMLEHLQDMNEAEQ